MSRPISLKNEKSNDIEKFSAAVIALGFTSINPQLCFVDRHR